MTATVTAIGIVRQTVTVTIRVKFLVTEARTDNEIYTDTDNESDMTMTKQRKKNLLDNNSENQRVNKSDEVQDRDSDRECD